MQAANVYRDQLLDDIKLLWQVEADIPPRLSILGQLCISHYIYPGGAARMHSSQVYRVSMKPGGDLSSFHHIY